MAEPGTYFCGNCGAQNVGTRFCESCGTAAPASVQTAAQTAVQPTAQTPVQPTPQTPVQPTVQTPVQPSAQIEPAAAPLVALAGDARPPVSAPFTAALVLFVAQQFVSPIVTWGVIASLATGDFSNGWAIGGLVVNIILFVVVAILMVAGAATNRAISAEARVGSSLLAVLAGVATIAGPFVPSIAGQLVLTLGGLVLWFVAWAIGNGYRGIGWVGLVLGPLGAVIATFLYVDFLLWTVLSGSLSVPLEVFLVFLAAAMLSLVVLLTFGATARWDRKRQTGFGSAATVVTLVIALAVVIPNLAAGHNAFATGLAGVTATSPFGDGYSPNLAIGLGNGDSSSGTGTGTDSQNGTADGTSGSGGTAPEVTGTDILSGSVSATSNLPPSTNYSYVAANVVDGHPATAWCEGVAGDGIGEAVTISFAQPVEVSGFTIDNGYWRTYDRLGLNNRVKTLSVRFDDGPAEVVSLSDPYEQGAVPDVGDSFTFSSPRTTTSVTFVIKAIYHELDTQASDTCISEIGLF